jgi:hypothetical protein
VDFWEARITKITVNDEDQSQVFETTFQQRVDFAPDLQPIIDAYGPSLQSGSPAGMRRMMTPPAGPPQPPSFPLPGAR